MGIPVYLSRYSHLPEAYGALVSWEIGQRCQFQPVVGGDLVLCTIESETMEHPEAPNIDGAQGLGRWVREVICADTGERSAVSEARLKDLEAT